MNKTLKSSIDKLHRKMIAGDKSAEHELRDVATYAAGRIADIRGIGKHLCQVVAGTLLEKSLTGNGAAAIEFVESAMHWAAGAEALASRVPNLLRPLTRKHPEFPALIRPNKTKDGLHKKRLAELEVGTDWHMNAFSPYVMKEDRDAETPVERLTTMYFELMLQIRSGKKSLPDEHVMSKCISLPLPPKRSDYRAWKAALQALLNYINANDPDAAKKWSRFPVGDDQDAKRNSYDRFDDIKTLACQRLKTILPNKPN